MNRQKQRVDHTTPGPEPVRRSRRLRRAAAGVVFAFRAAMIASSASVLALLGCGAPVVSEPPRVPTREQSQLLLLMRAIGGRDALVALPGTHYLAEGERWADLDSAGSGPPATRYHSELWSDSWGRFRVATERSLAFRGRTQSNRYTEVLLQEGGYLEGDEGLFAGAAPADGALSTARVAATREELRLLNPHVLLRELLGEPGNVEDLGETQFEGQAARRLGYGGLVWTVQAAGDRLLAVGELQDLGSIKDAWVEARYFDWKPITGSQVLLPGRVELRARDKLVLVERRPTAAQALTLPELAGAGWFVAPKVSRHFEPEARRGRTLAVVLRMAQASGLPIHDRLQLKVDAASLRPGVWQLHGGAHDSLLVEQEHGLVLIEAPIDQYRTHALYDWAAEQWPGRPITHVVVSQDRPDLSGGVREAVGRGARLVAHASTEERWRASLKAAATLNPDSLAESGRFTADFLGGAVTLPDPERPVTLRRAEGCGAPGTLAVAAGGVVYLAELTAPADGGLQCPLQPLIDGLVAQGAAVELLVGGHGAKAEPVEFGLKVPPASKRAGRARGERPASREPKGERDEGEGTKEPRRLRPVRPVKRHDRQSRALPRRQRGSGRARSAS